MAKTETNAPMRASPKNQAANVLIIDNDPASARLILEILARRGIYANLAGDKKDVADFLEKGDYDLVFLSAAPQTGFEILKGIKANSPELPVIMLTETRGAEIQDQQQSIETAVKAINAGCCDFLVKPLLREKIEHILDTFLPNHSVSILDSARHDSHIIYNIVGRSAKLLQTINLAKRIAPTTAPVLITGESGTGKELISYLIHHQSKRTQGPYVRVNCAALSDSLLESELFGHEKGAFTGAYTQRKGRFEMAHGGTLLLDEISETPLRFQAKLLRVLEQQDFERVGGNENVKVDVRVISTTNKNLLQETTEGRFRKDLYYRLSSVRLVISPLRERPDDLVDLVWYFVNLYARQAQRRITKLDPVMMDIFANYQWPGNVRQLRNVVLTSLLLGAGETLSVADVSWLFDELVPLPQEEENSNSFCVVRGASCETNPEQEKQFPGASKNTQYNSGLGGMPLDQIERQAILDTLRQTAGNQTRAAKVLGISDRTLRGKIRQYRKQGALQSV